MNFKNIKALDDLYEEAFHDGYMKCDEGKKCVWDDAWEVGYNEGIRTGLMKMFHFWSVIGSADAERYISNVVPEFDVSSFSLDRWFETLENIGLEELIRRVEAYEMVVLDAEKAAEKSQTDVKNPKLDMDFLNFLVNKMNPNELENYISMYNARDEKTEVFFDDEK